MVALLLPICFVFVTLEIDFSVHVSMGVYEAEKTSRGHDSIKESTTNIQPYEHSNQSGSC
jgi:hypothetical protein